jgi:hypothetical protein
VSRFQYQALTQPILPITAAVVATIGWFQPLSVPTIAKPFAHEQAAFFSPLSQAPETVSEDRWHQPLSQPVRRIPQTAVGVSVGPVSTSPETTTVDRWYQALGLPVWSKPALPSGLQQSYAAPLSELPETVSIDRWLQQLSLPVWPARGLGVVEQLTSAKPVSISPENVSVDRWLQPLSQPQFSKPGFRGDFAFWSGFTPVVVQSVSIGWFAPLSDPTRAVVRPVGLAVSPVSTSAESTTVDRWIRPLSEPVRIQPVRTGLSVGPVSTSPETTTVDRWYQALGLPVWPPRGLAGFLAPQPVKPISLSAETVSVDRWLQPLSQPVARITSARGGSVFWSGFTPAALPPAPNGWFQQLSQPTMLARQPQQQSFVVGYNIIITASIGSIYVIQSDQTMVALGSVFGMTGGSPFVDWMT